MKPGESHKTDLMKFTFGSLYFSGTQFSKYRGPQLLSVVNDCYLHFIRSGWSAPLAFILDVSLLLLSSGIGLERRWRLPQLPESLRKLGADYCKMLHRLQRNPKFQHVAQLVRATRDASRRAATLQVFLRFLLAELSEFEEIVSFQSREMVIHDLKPAVDGISRISMTTSKGRKDNLRFRLLSPERVLAEPVVKILEQMMRQITDYYTVHPLEEIISNEELFLIDYAARSQSSVDRLDYHLLYRLLNGSELPEPESWPPHSTMVEEVLPTESYQQDGQVGGYIDVNRKRLSEAISEVLPSELALKDHPEILYEKMLNEGLLHYIREDIERIEPELRVLFYFVVDTSEPMLQASRLAHEQVTPGLTPWVRGKALFVDMLRDLVRYFPRENVRADVVLYLWGPEAAQGYRQAFDLFEWNAERAASRYDFATDLAEKAPAFFHYHLQEGDQPERLRLHPDPYKNFSQMCENRRYHCRHLALLTSRESAPRFLPTSDLGLINQDYTRDSIWLVYPEVTRPTIGIARPIAVSGAGGGQPFDLGMLTEDQLRSQYLETVLLKAAARRPRRIVADVGEADHA